MSGSKIRTKQAKTVLDGTEAVPLSPMNYTTTGDIAALASSSGSGFTIPAGLNPDGVADSRVAIQNALNAVGAAGGGMVYCPPGTYLLNGDPSAPANSILLNVPSRTRLCGAGTSTIFKFGANLSANYIRGISNQSGAWGITLDHFFVDANGANNTNLMYAIYLYADSGFQPGPYDPAFGSGVMGSGLMDQIDHVIVYNSKGGGIQLGQYVSCSMITNCETFVTGDNTSTHDTAGIKVWDDQYVSDCIVGLAQGNGYAIAGVVHVTNCKSYGAGIFGHLEAAYTITGIGAQLDNVEAQECPGNGYVLNNATGAQITNARVEAVKASGVYLTGTSARCRVQLFAASNNLPSGSYVPTYGAYTDASGTGNVLDVATDGTMSVADVGGTTLVSQKVLRNTIGAVTTPSVSSGVAFTPNAQQNSDVYVQLAAGGAGSVTVTMGPSTGAESTLTSALAVASGAPPMLRYRVPAGWKLVVTVTTVTIAQTKVVTS